MTRKQKNTKICYLILTFALTGLWFSLAALAAEKKMVKDPTTGVMVIAPEYGGTFTFAMKQEPQTTDPMFGGGASRGVDGVAEKLGKVNWGIDRSEYDLTGAFFYFPPSVLTGRLAESWEMPDSTTIVFKIRQGVHWHNNAPMYGRELTAQDIEYNFHRVWGLGSGFTSPPETYTGPLAKIPVESVTATDNDTVVFKMEKPYLRALELILIDWGAFILPPEVIKQHGDVKDWRNLAGTGPFMLTDWVNGHSMSWTKNPDYWGFDEKFPENRLPYFDGVTGLIMKEDDTILAALRSGKLDYVGWAGGAEMINLPQKERIKRDNPEIAFYPWSIWSENVFAFNMVRDNPFSQDIKVRKAMQMALDLETINETYFKGTAMWTPQGLVGNAIIGYYTPFDEWPEEVQKGYRYDPEGAEKLLDDAGYPRGADGVRFKATEFHFANADLGYAEIAASYWASIGVDVGIEVAEPSLQMDRIREHNYGEMISWIAGIQNISPVSALAFGYSESKTNPAGLNDPEYDRLFEAVRDAATIEEAEKAAQAADMYNIMNHIYLWGPKAPKFNAVQPWVHGYSGEASLGNGEQMSMFARLWNDSAEKKENERYKFPWPPPQSTTQLTINREILKKNRDYITLEQVNDTLVTVLNNSYYNEMSYYPIPSGFALVTKMEQFNCENGTLMDSDKRWIVKFKPLDLSEIWSKEYLKNLFSSAKGCFRTIVFVVTDKLFQSGMEEGFKNFIELEKKGFNGLDPNLKTKDFVDDYFCEVLIYQFERKGNSEAKFVSRDEGFPVISHLKGAEMFDLLTESERR